MQLRTACTLDCPDACSLEVTVEAGRLVAVDAAPIDDTGNDDTGNGDTGGWVCSKVKQSPKLVHGPDRVLTPLRRTGPKGSGEFAPIGWDEALDLIAERVQAAVAAHGWSSVVPYLYSSSGGKLAADGLSPLVWEQLGAARTDTTICAAIVGEAWSLTYGDMASADPDDIAHSELIVVWGANPNVSHPHFAPALTARRKAGAKVVVVDPRRTPVAATADLHLAVRPGTDGVLAMAVAAILERDGHVDRDFVERSVAGADEYLAACRRWTPALAGDVCGVAAADIERFAALYATARPAMLRVGWGQERNRNGGSATRAIFALPALAGQFGVPGSGLFNAVRGGSGYDAARLRRAIVGDAPVPERRAINMNRLGRILTEGEGGHVSVLFVQGSNPAATCPEQATVLQGLARDDLFTVVHEISLTDTTRFADLVLPATTQFEVDDVAGGYGSFLVKPVAAVIDRVGESRTNDEVSAAIGVRLGLDAATWDPAPARVASLALGERTLPLRKRERHGSVQFRDTDPGAALDHRVHLVVDAPGVDRVPEYRELHTPGRPLTLLTPATSRTVSSMFGNVNAARADVRLHPDDAAARGVSAGERVRVSDGRHTIEATVAVDDTLRPGVAAMPKGMWLRDGDGGLTANAFAPDDLADLAGGATFNDARVEVTALVGGGHGGPDRT